MPSLAQPNPDFQFKPASQRFKYCHQFAPGTTRSVPSDRSICLSINLPTYLPTYLPISAYLCVVCLSVCLSVWLSICLSVDLSMNLSIHLLSIHLHLHLLSLSLSLCLYFRPIHMLACKHFLHCVHACIHAYLPLSLSPYVYVYVWMDGFSDAMGVVSVLDGMALVHGWMHK